MPIIRHRITREIIIAGNDLTGVDLSQADLSNVDGCYRGADDPPVAGYRVYDGRLQRPCRHCSNEAQQCGLCDCCCEHYTCNDCDYHVDSVCDECDSCSDCCTCEEEEDEQQEVTNTTSWINPGPLKRKQFNCRRAVGVEWEFTKRVDISRWLRKWGGGLHRDGSCGWEAVTPPIAGDYIHECLTEIGDTFKHKGVEITDSCGVHVHVDARDLRWADVYRLLMVYSHIEPALYILAGQQRINSEYCRPCGTRYREALTSIDRKGAVLSHAMFGRSTVDARAHVKNAIKKGEGRYKGLNISPWLAGRRRKAPDTTVEFRMHRDTLDPQRVIGWAQLLSRLVDWISNNTDQAACSLPKSPVRALCAIAPDLKPWVLDRVRAWREDTRAVERKIKVLDGYRIAS